MATIFQIENLLTPEEDFWKTLSDEAKVSILAGIKDLEEGRRIPYKKALTALQKKELDRRSDDFKDGTVRAIPWEEVEKKL